VPVLVGAGVPVVGAGLVLFCGAVGFDIAGAGALEVVGVGAELVGAELVGSGVDGGLTTPVVPASSPESMTWVAVSVDCPPSLVDVSAPPEDPTFIPPDGADDAPSVSLPELAPLPLDPPPDPESPLDEGELPVSPAEESEPEEPACPPPVEELSFELEPLSSWAHAVPVLMP
jgi:hypothetical protein